MSQALRALEGSYAYTAVPAMSRPGSGFSGESRAIRQAVDAIGRSVELSEALFGRKAAAISQIWTLVNECADADWDGNGAEPVDRLAAFGAADLVRALPPGVPIPEPAPEPDGSISLDWIRSRNRLFSLSVGTNDRLAFAWLDGSDKGHGVARFDGETIPTRILQGVAEVMGHGNTALEPS